jgi:hypothetical protein
LLGLNDLASHQLFGAILGGSGRISKQAANNPTSDIESPFPSLGLNSKVYVVIMPLVLLVLIIEVEL